MRAHGRRLHRVTSPHADAAPREAAPPLRYRAAVFLGALLLFQVQLIVGRRILPWFGGAPAVWTTCMLFFQVGLLAGYAYAHGLVRLPPRRQRDVHLGVLAGAVLVLAVRALEWPSSVTPGEAWKPDPAASPVAGIVALLAAGVGLPYLVLASTGPLAQAWVARVRPGTSPYRLFALSNLGSLVGLLGYPFVVEPWLPVVSQGRAWTIGFGVFALAAGAGALAAGRVPAVSGGAPAGGPGPPPVVRVLWFSLAAVPSVLLLAVTSQLCQDVAVVPLLWVLPLALYLLSFVLCFEYERLYRRGHWLAAVALAAAGFVYALFEGTTLAIGWQVTAGGAVLFAYGMACHGELAALKPDPGRLTSFYLTVAAGGAFGGVFTGLLAPVVFPGYWELHLALLGGPVLLVAVLLLDPESRLNRGPAARVWGTRLLAYAALGGLLGALGAHVLGGLRGAAALRRGFFGVLTVSLENRGEPDEWRKLKHGRISHGLQLTAPERRREPTTYYGPKSGVALALVRHPRRLAGEPLRVGLVGLGVGTLAAYARGDDAYRVYEINPDVLALSTGPDPVFTFLRDAPAEVATVLGDARISLEREPPQALDVLALDAFSGDAIPVHLLTREAFALYRRHLREPHGVIAVHVSNKYLDLRPVVSGLAGAFGLRAAVVSSPEAGNAVWSSDWILVMGEGPLLRDPELATVSLPLAVDEPGLPVWTDDWSPLVGVVRLD